MLREFGFHNRQVWPFMFLEVADLSFQSDRNLGQEVLFLFVLHALLAEVGKALVGMSEMKRTA